MLLEAGLYGQNDETKKVWLQNVILMDLARMMIVVPEADIYEQYC